MSKLTLTEPDFAALAAVLGPLMLPYIRRQIIDDLAELIEDANPAQLAELSGTELGAALATKLHAIFAASDERRFTTTTQSITLGTMKGERN